MDKRKLTTLALLAGFVLLLGGALALYRTLGRGAAPGLAVEPTPAPAATASPEQAGPAEDAAAEEQQAEESAAAAVPDFTIYTGEGDAVQLSDFAGRPVIVNFWASWCGPCQNEMPDFEQAYADYGDEIEFVMLNATYGRETMDSARSFLEESGYTFPVYYDTDADAAAAIGVTAFPTTLFIGPDGTLTAYAISMLDAETLQRGIDMLLDSAA